MEDTSYLDTFDDNFRIYRDIVSSDNEISSIRDSLRHLKIKFGSLVIFMKPNNTNVYSVVHKMFQRIDELIIIANNFKITNSGELFELNNANFIVDITKEIHDSYDLIDTVLCRFKGYLSDPDSFQSKLLIYDFNKLNSSTDYLFNATIGRSTIDSLLDELGVDDDTRSRLKARIMFLDENEYNNGFDNSNNYILLPKIVSFGTYCTCLEKLSELVHVNKANVIDIELKSLHLLKKPIKKKNEF